MLRVKDRTQVVEQSMICNNPLWSFLGLDGRLERSPSINRLVTSSHSTYMIFPTLLPLWQSPTNLFIIWVLEGSGCGSTCPGNDVKLYLMVRFQFWRFGECGAPLHHHCSLVHSDPEWQYLLGSHLWVKQKNVFIKRIVYPLRMNLFQNFIGIK